MRIHNDLSGALSDSAGPISDSAGTIIDLKGFRFLLATLVTSIDLARLSKNRKVP